MSSVVRVLLLLQIGFLLFLFLLWLLWPKFPKLCWIVVVKVGTLVLFLTSGECFQFFTTEDNVCCGFVIYSFYYVDFAPSILAFLRVFIINGCWILSKAFSASTEIITWFLIFQFINVMYHIDWFVNTEESLHPWDKAHLVMMYNLFNMLLDSVC